jgi:hypothetical protein
VRDFLLALREQEVLESRRNLSRKNGLGAHSARCRGQEKRREDRNGGKEEKKEQEMRSSKRDKRG